MHAACAERRSAGKCEGNGQNQAQAKNTSRWTGWCPPFDLGIFQSSLSLIMLVFSILAWRRNLATTSDCKQQPAPNKHGHQAEHITRRVLDDAEPGEMLKK